MVSFIQFSFMSILWEFGSLKEYFLKDFHVKVFKTNPKRIKFLNKSMISEILDLSWHDSVYPYDSLYHT